MIPSALVENGVRRNPDSREVEEFCRLERDGSNTLNLKYHVMAGFENQPGRRKMIKGEGHYHNWLIKLGRRFFGQANDVGQR